MLILYRYTLSYVTTVPIFLRIRNSRFTPEYLYSKNSVFVCQFKWLIYFKYFFRFENGFSFSPKIKIVDTYAYLITFDILF